MENNHIEVCQSFSQIEEEMKKFHPEFKKLSLKEIASHPKTYKVMSSKLDDHFCVLVRSQDKKATSEAKKYLKKCGFKVYGNIDRYGIDMTRDQLLDYKMPVEDVDKTLNKALEYLHIDLSKEEDIGVNKEGDYYFYFYPIKEDVTTWTDFKKQDYLDNLNEFAKKYHSTIDLIFSQLDNVIFGGIRIPGVASEKFYHAYFEDCTLQIDESNPRSMFIAIKNILELVHDESELKEIGSLNIFMVEKLFFQEDIEEIYLDYPNELDDDYLL